MKSELMRQFANPPAVYRGKPFWAWNGKLAEPELRRQIRLMHAMGLGGFFMHSRVGLATPYLSPEWFKMVGACVDEAAKLGMEAWLYDEDRWPSGAAGGLVTRNPLYRMRYLVLTQMKKARAFKRTPDVLAVFAARVKGCVAAGVRRIGLRERMKLAPGETLLVFSAKTAACSSWYNGYTYLDTMSHAAVRAFIRSTYDPYARHFQREFGKTIPGIFTDEPNYFCHSRFATALPWTPQLPAVFRARCGYDLAAHLPELFFDVAGVRLSKARYHYYACITFLFTDAFGRQVGEWCRRHRFYFTGHVLAENTLITQAACVGNCMRFYEFMQAPGMDLLTEFCRAYDTAKQVSSVAHQFGWKWRLTETYGCTGWDFPLAGHKALGDWQVALGINLRCQHLAWYTMEGEAKRDYPAAIFYQSPWWELYPKVEDYFARIHAAMTRGEEVRDILVIHPMESMWAIFRPIGRRNADIAAYDKKIVALRDSLLAAHLDFDYGDEDILARHARLVIARGRPAIRLRRAVYSSVVVPPLKTMRRSTLNLLKRFAAAGGRVVFAGAPAGHVDAEPSKDVRRLAAGCVGAPARGRPLAAAVEKGGRRVSIADPAGREIAQALYLLREDREAFYLFICNTGLVPDGLSPEESDIMVRDRRAAFPDVRVTVFENCAGAPVELNPETGASVAANAALARGYWTIQTYLPALGSRLFVIPKSKQAQRLPKAVAYHELRERSLARARWPISLSEPNVLALDYPRFRVGAGQWQAADEILRVDTAIRKQIGLEPRGGAMVQPWARKEEPASRRVGFALSYAFEAETVPAGPLFLAIEQPLRFRVEINGNRVTATAECGWWVDRSLRKLPVDPAYFRIGRNEIRLAGEYDSSHPGLEIIYLLGEFGVRLKGARPALTARPETLAIGDWCRQGLTFYAGSVGYQCPLQADLRRGERLFVCVPAYRGAAVRVLVNGRSAGVIAWDPSEVDVTDFLAPRGKPNLLQIEVIGHRRNSHGPLHLNRKWPLWTGPAEYRQIKGPGYQLVPCGLMAAPRLSVRRAI